MKPNFFKLIILLTLITFSSFIYNSHNAKDDGKLYEMRIYYAPEGKLNDLHSRFRNHTLKLFEKHGMENIGYWVPMENTENKLIYILAFPNKEAREKAWKDFIDDPAWKKVHVASERQGKLVDRIESILMKTTDFSPQPVKNTSEDSRVFELRTYKSPPGKLNDLMGRFRNHTINLFTKHGMEHIGYWQPLDKEQGAENTLIYILAHESKEAAEQSFTSFRVDTDWIAAKEASEAEGPIVENVESLFMVPTDYSQIK
jgi:hypothetical protein